MDGLLCLTHVTLTLVVFDLQFLLAVLVDDLLRGLHRLPAPIEDVDLVRILPRGLGV